MPRVTTVKDVARQTVFTVIGLVAACAGLGLFAMGAMYLVFIIAPLFK